MASGEGQKRGNSGILLSGALYGRYPPLVNACRKPGQWHVFDIIFEAPRFDQSNQIAQPARVTVLQNGIVLHHAIDTGGQDPDIQITLQNHWNPVRFRNIWVRRLKGYDER